MNVMHQLIKEFEKICNQKVTIETNILHNMQDQITTDKASKYLAKLYYDLKVKNRTMVGYYVVISIRIKLICVISLGNQFR